MHLLKSFAFAVSITLIAQSCYTPAYVENTPPPPPPQTYAETPPPPAYGEQAPVSYQTFYSELSPYGQWVSNPEYGYVWVPAAGTGFEPYATGGHWVLTNYGWTWASDYSWGWAPFHYGTWDYDAMMGWYWIPGYQWSPAWVSWRSTPGYYGWAPLGPSYATVGYAAYSCPPERYVFVQAQYINSPSVSTYYMPRNTSATYFTRSSVVSNTYGSNNTYYAGPPRDEVERATGTPVQQVNMVSVNSPERGGVSGNEVRMFRPSVQQPANNVAKPAPPKVFQPNEVQPVAQRQVLTQTNQARTVPYNPENVQHANNTPQEQNRGQVPAQQQPQRQPAQQQPVQAQHSQFQEPQRAQQQQPAQQQQANPAQNQQRFQQPAKQQPQQSRQPRQPKPQKAKQAKPQQSQSGGQSKQ